MAERKVTIVILTWNGLAYTRRCLETLRTFTAFSPYDVIVVDNGSTDGTPEFLDQIAWARVIKNAENLGFVRGNNAAIRAADPRSDCVLLNNDVEIYQPDWLARLQNTAYEDPKIGVVGCRQIRPEGRLLHAGAYMPIDTFWGQQVGGLEKDVNQYPFTREVETVAFGCVYVKRSTLDAVGLLDEDYFSYFEDSDYCARVREKGLKVVCCGAVTVIHHENVSTRINKVKLDTVFAPSMETFRRKWEAKMRAAYSHPVVWHSTASLPLGYALASRAIMRALDDQKVDVSYRYAYGPGTPFPYTESSDLHDYQVNLFKARPASAIRPQIVFGQGDIFERNFGAYRVGFTMLEVDGLPKEWVRQANEMDEVWVPAPFNERTFRESGVTRPIHVVPLGIDPNYFNPLIRGHPIEGLFTFLSIFEWGERKAPEVLLKAFNEAFSAKEDVVLIVKTVNHDPGVDVAAQVRALGLRPDGGRIHLSLNDFVPAYQLGSLYRSADCFVLPTHGEGFGMPILEAMACGLPVIATDWSAQQFFMNETNGYPVRVKGLVPAVAKCPYYAGHQWADPDVDHLRHLLRHVYENRDEARVKGQRASAEVLAGWTWAHTAARVIGRLQEIGPAARERPSVRRVRSTTPAASAVGIDVSRAIGQPTGVGTYALNLVKALAATDREHDYVLYPGFGPFVHPDYPARARLDVELPGNFRFYTDTLPAFAPQREPTKEFEGSNSVDIVHSTGNTAPDVGSATLVMTVYDLTFRLFPELHTPENIELCERGMQQAAARAEIFIAISESTKADLAQTYGISEHRIRVVYPAIDPSFRPVDDAPRLSRTLASYGIERPFVLFVGANEPRKNLKRVIQAYDAVRSRRETQDHALVIAGAAGWLNEDVRRLVNDRGLEADVRFLGYVRAVDLPVLYTACRAFVYPSLYEGFGLPVAEAMACGAPVITSKVSSLPEVAGEAAALVDPYSVDELIDAMTAVLDDDTYREHLRKRALERARQFSLERMARETLTVYDALRRA